MFCQHFVGVLLSCVKTLRKSVQIIVLNYLFKKRLAKKRKAWILCHYKILHHRHSYKSKKTPRRFCYLEVLRKIIKNRLAVKSILSLSPMITRSSKLSTCFAFICRKIRDSDWNLIKNQLADIFFQQQFMIANIFFRHKLRLQVYETS